MKIIRYLLLFVLYMCAINNIGAQNKENVQVYKYDNGGTILDIYKDSSKVKLGLGFDGSKIPQDRILTYLSTRQDVIFAIYFDCTINTGDTVRIRYNDNKQLKNIDWNKPIRMLVMDDKTNTEWPILAYNIVRQAGSMDAPDIYTDITQLDQNERVKMAMEFKIKHGGFLQLGKGLIFEFEGCNNKKKK